jgi:signal transduction histidine kinase
LSDRLWVGGAALLAALLASAALAPGAREFARLELPPVLALLSLTVAAAVAIHRLEARGALTTGQRGLGDVAIAFLTQLSLSSVVTFARPPGSFAFAAVPLLGAWVQLPLLRASARQPWPVAAQGLGIAAAAGLRPDALHAGILAIVALAGLLGGLCFSFLGLRVVARRADLDAHRAAIAARALDERSAELRRVSQALLDVLESSHDASSALSTSLLTADLVAEATARGAKPEEVAESARVVSESLARLERAVEETRRLGERAGRDAPRTRAVAVAPLARQVLQEASRRFPQVALSFRSAGDAETARARLAGGEESLRRVVENLVANACEGDGRVRARFVELAVSRRAGSLALEVSDDGPGFAQELLAGPIAPFVTSKRDGSGLGLYTAERLVRASQGSLERENRSGGGGLVRVLLPEMRDEGEGERNDRGQVSAC